MGYKPKGKIMDTKTFDLNKIKEVCSLLPSQWRYNAILGKQSNWRGHYLTNGEGLIINIRDMYDFNLPQWSLSIRHPTYPTLIKINQIGCCLKKPSKNIVLDLKKRLLPDLPLAYKKLEELTALEAKKHKNRELHTFVVNALSKVITLTPFHDSRGSRNYEVTSKEGVQLARLKSWDNSDQFDLDVKGLSAEKIIKIMEILNK